MQRQTIHWAKSPNMMVSNLTSTTVCRWCSSQTELLFRFLLQFRLCIIYPIYHLFVTLVCSPVRGIRIQSLRAASRRIGSFWSNPLNAFVEQTACHICFALGSVASPPMLRMMSRCFIRANVYTHRALRTPQLRLYSLKRPEGEYENEIFSLLEKKFNPSQLLVQDVSGGCGSMFAIRIESTDFKGLTPVKQQQLVYKALGPEIAKWHGLQLKTSASK